MPRAENTFPKGSRVYLSKSHLRSGVWRFENEELVEARLREHGVLVVYPEELSLAEQVALFGEDVHIITTMGSAIHNLICGRPPASAVFLCRENQMISNFLMIDDLVGAKPTYLFPNQIRAVQSETFGLSLELSSPISVADELFEASLSASRD